jgi:transketolase
VATDLEPAATGTDLQPALDRFDLASRTLTAILYNFAPCSGHPGGSISMGRILAGLLLEGMAYDIADPVDRTQDVLCLAAGHKAMGLYAMLALRDETVRIARPGLLPGRLDHRLRLEDLLGFRRNPVQRTELVERFGSKPLDGHPTPATPFVRLATGPSGVGVASAVGLALGMLDVYGRDAPLVHVIEGEGGATTGRVSEAMAAASAGQIENLVLHVDWNQSTIDSDACCRTGDAPGEYVQWDPVELAYLHDFNAILVPDGHDAAQVRAAQRAVLSRPNRQPTCIVYRTVKGRGYGIEGRRSHGAGHGFCSPGFHEVLRPFEARFDVTFPRYEGGLDDASVERAHWEALQVVRRALEADRALCDLAAGCVERAAKALAGKGRRPRPRAPDLDAYYGAIAPDDLQPPPRLRLEPGSRSTLRGQLGRCLGHIGRLTRGGVMGSAADLLHSTSVSKLAAGMGDGFFRLDGNPDARLVSAGGICEDAMGGMMAGLSAFGMHIGVSASYAAFIAPLEHIPARCHAIGQEAKRRVVDEPPNPFVIVMGHASIKTGEDGPTHADPQSLQLFQENFLPGSCATLTPWEPGEVWPLLHATLSSRHAVIAAYVTRPEETVPDRKALGLPPAEAAAKGIYAVRRGEGTGTVILQGSGVANEFFPDVLPELDRRGLALNVFYVSSAELFAALPPSEREEILPERLAAEAMGITDFTLPTLQGFVTSRRGREASLHPFGRGRHLGSGKASRVLEEAGLDAASQLEAVLSYVDGLREISRGS